MEKQNAESRKQKSGKEKESGNQEPESCEQKELKNQKENAGSREIKVVFSGKMKEVERSEQKSQLLQTLTLSVTWLAGISKK